MPPTERDRLLRAELAAELGFYPARLALEDVEALRRQYQDADRAPSLERVHAKYGHLREAKRRAEAEAAGRDAVADLYE
ncbi:hypothetical protein M4D79_23260 [Mycolicibacterium novocastrense]|nr:hypothetical protein M4D79_23260 [Mycolicibacterium novocastrense]